MSSEQQRLQEVIRGVLDEDRLLKPEEAAALLGIKRTKMYGLINKRAIDSVRVGQRGIRITRRALRAYIAHCAEAQ